MSDMKQDKPVLIVAVSSRAIFDFEEENCIFKEKGVEAYIKEQRRLSEVPAAPGVAMPMVKKLLAMNGNGADRLVEVVVLSRNDPITGLRVGRSIEENRLDIRSATFTRGWPAFPYLRAFGAHLFLSALAEDVKAAIDKGFAAAHVMGGGEEKKDEKDEVLRIAFDGDAVLFGDESERVYQEKGLPAFEKNEREKAHKPLSPGPLKPFLDALLEIKKRRPQDAPRLRTALVTARSIRAHERPMRTFLEWGVEMDESFFLDGHSKEDILDIFRPDFFFDDQTGNLFDRSGHVPYGIKNK